MSRPPSITLRTPASCSRVSGPGGRRYRSAAPSAMARCATGRRRRRARRGDPLPDELGPPTGQLCVRLVEVGHEDGCARGGARARCHPEREAGSVDPSRSNACGQQLSHPTLGEPTRSCRASGLATRRVPILAALRFAGPAQLTMPQHTRRSLTNPAPSSVRCRNGPTRPCSGRSPRRRPIRRSTGRRWRDLDPGGASCPAPRGWATRGSRPAR